MKKHTITALAAALCLLCTGLPAGGFTETAPLTVSAAAAKLTYGDLTYSEEDGCITITGCDDKIESTEIPSEIDGMPVTRIGSTAFYGCALTSIEIPEGVTELGSGAFWHCKSLSHVKLPSTLTAIQSYVFNDCAALGTIDIPESVTYIGNAAFGDTPWLAAQQEASDCVIVNGILIDATKAVSKQIEAAQAEKERLEQEFAESLIWKRASVITNQVGYFTGLQKKATLITEADAAVEFEVLAADGTAVFRGTSKPLGFDTESGDTVHELDFTALDKEGTYTIRAASGETSREFTVGVTDKYSGLLYDALNYFYQNRSGIEIEQQYITSGNTGELSRAAGHVPDSALTQAIWDFTPPTGTQDVTGGWYDAGDHGKYVVNGGVSLWTMQNEYERALLKGTAAAYADGTMQIPENGNGYPDLLDEARYEMEWMLTMIVPEGDCAGMVYSKVHDNKWTGLGLEPANDTAPRWLLPPTTAATLNMAACGAQAYRLWKELDADFADKCLTASKNAYEAAKAHPDMLAPSAEYGGGGAYGDSHVTDEFYWAACELYTATGDESYLADLSGSAFAYTVPQDMGEDGKPGLLSSYNWGSTAALGSLTLLLHSDTLSADNAKKLNDSLTATADAYAAVSQKEGYGQPFEGLADKNGYVTYPWGSNSFVADNAVILAYAYDATGNADYLNGVVSAMDYILGRNPLDFSYVTGYGVHSAQYPHHRFWAKSVRDTFPKAPCGVLTGGPNTDLADSTVKDAIGRVGETPALLCYVDDIQAYSVNECAINWNAPLAWVTGYLCEQNGGILAGQPSAGVQLPEPEEPEEIPLHVVVNIPEGVTGVGEQVFGKYAASVNEVTVPDGVTLISKEAFYRCTKLDDLTLPETIEEVGDNAFGETPWLTAQLAESPMLIINGLLIDGSSAEGDVVIPDGVTRILGNAFDLNTKITSVTVPEGVTQIGASAFAGCSSLETLTLPESLRVIGASAFDGAAITELTIPAGVTSVGEEAFVNCKSLDEATVLGRSTVIGREAFGCTSTFTANGQYSYIFIHLVLEDFTVNCYQGSTADKYADTTGLQVKYLSSSGGNGDVDENGTVDLLDVILLNKNILGLEKLTDKGRANADVDGNGSVDSTDSLYILQSTVSLVTLPV